MTKILFNGNRIIFDGHAETAEECRAITAMCDSMASNENFKTIIYEEGHAVFEQVRGGDSMMFAMPDYVLTSRYNKETGYSANEVAYKGTIAKRLLDLEEGLSEHVSALELSIAALQERIAVFESKTSRTLPYTAEELEAKLANL